MPEIEEIMDESESIPSILLNETLNEILDLIDLALVLENYHKHPSSVWITVGKNAYQEGTWFAAICNGCGSIDWIDMSNNGAFRDDGGLTRLQLKELIDEDSCFLALQQIYAELRNKYAEEFFESKGFIKPDHGLHNRFGFYIVRKVN